MTSESGAAAPQTPASQAAAPQTAPQTLNLGRISVAAQPVADYLQAVGDQLPIYRQTGLAPPLYAAAAALGLLLQTLKLPPGAIHSLQDIDTLAPIAIGQDLPAAATLERPRQRGGLRFITASCNLANETGSPALTAKTTVLIPNAPAPGDPANRNGPGNNGVPGNSDAPSDLPVISRAITPERLQAYAAASGDDNPLHLDPHFAAATQFGGIIAHGMLTLAFLSEMMTAALGRQWLTAGSLRARFKGAAYLGDQVETWGQPASLDGRNFAVGVRNRNTGENLITGAAAVKHQ